MPATTETVVAGLTVDEAKILAHFGAAGETLDEVAEHAGATKAEVIRVVEEIATNNRSYARNLALAWQQKNARPAVVKPVTAVPSPVDDEAPTDAIADLLSRAVATEVPRLVRLADKVQDLVDDLEEQLTEHERGRALRAEAEKLERRLTQIRQELGQKRPAATPASVVDSKAVRAWAAAAGVECPKLGRVPGSVLAAYERREASDG